MQNAAKDLQADPNPRVRSPFLPSPPPVDHKAEDVKLAADLITDEEASRIDLGSIEKEIAAEAGEKKAKMPLGFKIDEIDV
jgi:hypothetical protein